MCSFGFSVTPRFSPIRLSLKTWCFLKETTRRGRRHAAERQRAHSDRANIWMFSAVLHKVGSGDHQGPWGDFVGIPIKKGGIIRFSENSSVTKARLVRVFWSWISNSLCNLKAKMDQTRPGAKEEGGSIWSNLCHLKGPWWDNLARTFTKSHFYSLSNWAHPHY